MEPASPLDPLSRDPGERRVGSYRLLKKIGQGGMGVVHEAQRGNEPLVALKMLRERPDDPDAVRRFHREARALMAIDSPHVVRVLDEGDADGLPYFVMELLAGRALDSWLRQLGPLLPSTAARLFSDACAGLAAAHARGLIHRDIKPANLFLHQTDAHLTLKLCDFGVAKQLDTSRAQLSVTDLTSSGGLIGSPTYMSPEQARDGSLVDERSDIWSLCLSLHETLSGLRPWQGCRTVGELILAIHSNDLPPLRAVAPWVPAALAAVVERGLRRDPAARWPDAGSLRNALLPFAAASPLLAADLRPADTSQPPTPGSTWAGLTTSTPLPRSRASLALGGVTLGTALLLLWLRGPSPAANPVAPRAEARPATSTPPVASARVVTSATEPTSVSSPPTPPTPSATTLASSPPTQPSTAAPPARSPRAAPSANAPPLAAPASVVSAPPTPKLRGFDD